MQERNGEIRVSVSSLEETQQAAKRLAACLGAGDVLCLSGDLGAGKTTFTRALVAALGAPAALVTSPTFTLLHEYRGGRLPVWHGDAYRLTDGRDLDDIGLGNVLAEAEGIVVLEWPERVADALPPERLDITLEETGETARQITLTPRGPRWTNLAEEWNRAC